MTTSDAGAWLADAAQKLSGLTDRPHSEAQALLSKVTGRPREWLITHSELPLKPDLVREANHLLDRLLSGEPLPYLLGQWEFFGLQMEVTPAVLIPRPETELLVETALHWLKRSPGRRAADVGTGSGCIAASLAVHCSGLHLTATDISIQALRVAQRNFSRYHLLGRVFPVQSDLLSALRGPFDLVCANLPYIPTPTLTGLPVNRFEPRLALDGGPDGLDLIARLMANAPRWLAPGGVMLFEIEAGQGQSAPALARQTFPAALIDVIPDLAGHPRLLKVQVE